MLLGLSFAFAEDNAQKLEKDEMRWYERDSLFLASATQNFSEETGFTPFVTWTGEAWGNFANSSNIRGIFDSLFTFGFEQDFSAITGKKGWGRFGISTFYYTQSGNGSVGDFDSSQGCFSNILSGEIFRVFEFYYINELETSVGNFAIRVGQLAADEDFMGMDYSDIFLNSSYGAIPNVAPANMFSQYNVATLGFVAYYAYENIDAMFGFYDGNISDDTIYNNGFDYTDCFGNIALFYQIGFNYALSELEGRVIVGGNYHSGNSKIKFDKSNFSDFYSFYLGVQQALINDSDGNVVIGLFMRAGFVPDKRSSDQNFYADFGFNWFSPIPNRANDVFAVGFSIVENERNARQDYAHYESALEVTYKCQLTPTISVQPDMQIFFNPKSRNESGAAYILGARMEVIF